MKTVGRRSWIWGATAATALAATITGTQLRHVDIVVESPQGTRNVRFWTFRATVRRVLAQAGLGINQHDRISQNLSQTIGPSPLVVREAIPIWIQTAHRHFRGWTTHYHVQNILKSFHIKLGPLDRVTPGLHGALNWNGTLTVVRRWLVTREISVALPYAIQYRPNPNLWKGQQTVAAPGHDGQAVKQVQVLMQDGQPVRQTVLGQKVVNPPQNEVVLYGTRQLIARGGQVLQFSRVLTMVSTAYWPDPAWSNGYTTLGMKAHYGVVAVDPRVIPLGTRLYIPGYGFAVAADTGSAIVGDRIDLCFDTQAPATAWGVRTVRVFILK
ncbi:MAG: 3D domain-containing protein [Thermaerobacter sp.]|nr:3D domain-containing protein [Thermaerobacter sp.]